MSSTLNKKLTKPDLKSENEGIEKFLNSSSHMCFILSSCLDIKVTIFIYTNYHYNFEPKQVLLFFFFGLQLDAPLWTMMRSPPPFVTTTTSIEQVVDLLIEKGHKLIVVVNHNDLYGTNYNSSLRAVGIFASAQLSELITTESNSPREKPSICRRL